MAKNIFWVNKYFYVNFPFSKMNMQKAMEDKDTTALHTALFSTGKNDPKESIALFTQLADACANKIWVRQQFGQQEWFKQVSGIQDAWWSGLDPQLLERTVMYLVYDFRINAERVMSTMQRKLGGAKRCTEGDEGHKKTRNEEMADLYGALAYPLGDMSTVLRAGLVPPQTDDCDRASHAYEERLAAVQVRAREENAQKKERKEPEAHSGRVEKRTSKRLAEKRAMQNLAERVDKMTMVTSASRHEATTELHSAKMDMLTKQIEKSGL
ncbi:hypothetical protein NKR23_g167 [Pleurostoma richardsiae]|uniref:Uncharacterized protein n=1 Tax=Pleurostoma richardsiae TaxID=41990 RepID=A0AA38VXM0_9PEZI|nr:hypothetical protein NKR23_g167 [Pleurostoma richardsiae]